MKTNDLNSHHPESRSSRVDKMSGLPKEMRSIKVGRRVKRGSKKFFNRKRRMILKNPLFFEKV